MALTNFAALTDEQKTVWSRQFWAQARNASFMNKFMGTSENSMIQRITELKKDEKGARAVITLIADLVGDGVAGDSTLEGKEEALKSYDQVITIDQLRHANEHEGRMAEQKSVVTFREQSKDKLAYWMGDRMDQLALLTLSGVSYAFRNNGAPRVGSDLANLEYAAAVTAPTANRHLRWDSVTGLQSGDTAVIDANDVITYKSIIDLKTFAKDNYIRGIRGAGNEEYFHLFVTPKMMGYLKKDADYIANLRNAGVRGPSNELFAGASSSVMVEGVIVHEFRHVFNTSGAASGSKWGAGGLVNGGRALFCGAQALGFADIGDAYWVEQGKDYENRQGISIGKIFGFLKPKFHRIYSETVEDFGVVAVDFAQ
jgi:N4-gp56 family major capsid protein